jgi:hypothetical protein
MNSNTVVLGLIMISCLVAGTAIGLLISEQVLTSSGNIVILNLSIKTYSDSACTNQINTLSWGTLNQGSHKEITIYLKNSGNVPATLDCSFTGWNPSIASNYITISWNRNGSTIGPGEILSAKFSLDVSDNIVNVSTFSCTTTITGTG